MPAVIMDMWSLERPDMAEAASACAKAGIWGDSAERELAFHGEDPAHDMRTSPSLQLDWDGSLCARGRPVARVVATGKFHDPKGQLFALAKAAGLPVIDHKADFGRLELRLAAPLAPGRNEAG